MEVNLFVRRLASATEETKYVARITDYYLEG
jgi:hypothetical protein